MYFYANQFVMGKKKTNEWIAEKIKSGEIKVPQNKEEYESMKQITKDYPDYMDSLLLLNKTNF